MTTIIAKNQTAGDLPLNQLSAPDCKIPASGQVTLTDFNQVKEIQEDVELQALINSDDVLLNNGTDDLTKIQSLYFASTVTMCCPSSDCLHNNVDGEINGVASKGSPVGADVLLIEDSAASWVKKKATVSSVQGAGGGDNITVNGSAVTDADFDDSTPAAPASGVNVKWQQAGSGPTDVSAYGPTAAPLQGIGAGNTEGSATSLARSDHDHTIREFGGQDLTTGAVGDGQLVHRSGTALAGVNKAGIDSDAIHDNVDGEIDGITQKATPVGADLLLIEDSEATNAKKKIQIQTLPLQLKQLGQQNVLTVAADGGADYTTIAAALAAASSGGVILIYPGTYAEAITLVDGVTLMGIGGGSGLVVPPPVKIQQTLLGAAGGTAVTCSAGYCRLVNIEVQVGWTGSAGDVRCVNISGTGTLYATGCQFNLTAAGATGGNGYGVHQTGGSGYSKLKDCRASVTGVALVEGTGVYTSSADYLQVFGSELEGETNSARVNNSGADVTFGNCRMPDGLAVTNASIVRLHGGNRISSITDSGGKVVHDEVSADDYAEKTSLVDGDLLVVADSADSYNRKKVQLNTLPFMPFGKVLTVDQNDPGADYSTIAAALAAASSGDTILIGPGTYNEQLTLVDGVTLEGIGGALPLATTGDTLSTVITQSAGAGPAYAAQTPASGSVFLRNLHIKLTFTGASGDARALYGAGATIRGENCAFEVQASGATGGNGYGVHMGSGTGGCNLRDCEAKVAGSSLDNDAAVYVGVGSPTFMWRTRLASISTSLEINHGLVQMQLYDCQLPNDLVLTNVSSSCYIRGGTWIGGSITDPGNDLKVLDFPYTGIQQKVSPVGADRLLIEDSADSARLKAVQLTNLPGGADADAIHDNVAAEISAITEKTAVVDADLLVIEDSEASNAKKRTTVKNVLSRRREKSVTIESPSASEDISWFFTNRAVTITEIRSVVGGSPSPSVTWTVRHATNRSTTGAEVVTGGTTTTDTTTGDDITSFDDATIVADSHVWFETTASSQCDWIHLTVFYMED